MLLTYSFLFLVIFETVCSIFNFRQRYLECVSFFRFSTFMLIILVMLQLFKLNNYSYQYIMIYKIDNNFLNFSYSIGVDGISLLFILLSCLLIFVCFIFVWPIYKIENYDGILVMLLLCLVAAFFNIRFIVFLRVF